MDNQQGNIETLLVSRRSAARALGISVRSLDYLVQAGRLRTRKIGRRVLIPLRVLEEFARHDHPGRNSGGPHE
jgi:excisionase family DNA binding protein